MGAHFHSVPITIFDIRKLLYLVHGGCLWLEDPIPITEHLIHYITQLPFKGEHPTDISEVKSSDLAIVEATKKKYKLENKKQGYAISSINDKAVRMVTQILAGTLCASAMRMSYLRRW